MPLLNLYTSGPMINLTITTAEAAGGAEATGYPIENAFDHNPDTLWKASTVDGATIDIDLGAAYTVDSFSLWVKNNEEFSYDSGHKINLQYSSTDDGLFATVSSMFSMYPGVLTTELQNSGATTGVSRRYWRIDYHGNPISTVGEFGGFWLHRDREISKSSQLPRNDSITYYNQVSVAGGGREFVRGVNSNPVDTMPRTYLIDDTDWTALSDAFDDSRGRRLPMVAVESGQDTRLVRFSSDTLRRNEISHEIYNPSFTLKEVPYVSYGDTY